MSKVLVADIDGTVADFNRSYAQLLNKIQGNKLVDPFSDSHLTAWDWDKLAGYDYTTIEKAWVEIENSGVFWVSLFPYPTAYEDFRALQDFGGDLYFCTKRPGKQAKWETEQWLRGHGFKNPTVVICEDKEAFCDSVKATAIVDDKPGNLSEPEFEFPWKRILFKRPWNTEFWGKFDLAVDSYKEALNAL